MLRTRYDGLIILAWVAIQLVWYQPCNSAPAASTNNSAESHMVLRRGKGVNYFSEQEKAKGQKGHEAIDGQQIPDGAIITTGVLGFADILLPSANLRIWQDSEARVSMSEKQVWLKTGAAMVHVRNSPTCSASVKYNLRTNRFSAYLDSGHCRVYSGQFDSILTNETSHAIDVYDLKTGQQWNPMTGRTSPVRLSPQSNSQKTNDQPTASRQVQGPSVSLCCTTPNSLLPNIRSEPAVPQIVQSPAALFQENPSPACWEQMKSTCVDAAGIPIPIKSFHHLAVMSIPISTNYPKKPEPAEPTHSSPADIGPYVSDTERRIKRAWFPPRSMLNKSITATLDVLSSGVPVNIEVQENSGDRLCEHAVIEAIRNASPFRPLPIGSPTSLTFKVNFSNTDR